MLRHRSWKSIIALTSVAVSITASSTALAGPGLSGALALSQSTNQGAAAGGDKKIKSYLTVKEVGGRVLFEIPVGLLGRDILWTVERGFEGSEAPSNLSAKTTSSIMIRWEKIGDKLFVRNLTPSLSRRAGDMPVGPAGMPSSDQKIPPMQRAVAESSIAPTMLALPISTGGPEGSLVVDMTSAFLSDLPELQIGKAFGPARVDPSRSYIESVREFPRNVLITSYITAAPVSGAASLSATLKHNLTLLPDVPMRPRLYDSRVGIFTVDFEQYSESANAGVVNQSYLRRYRLEKKNPAAAVSEPVKPIVYYVGRTIPAKWRPYVRQGIEDWQGAFEAAGFKNAIIAKDAPLESEDPNWDPSDTSISVIRWIANPIVNAIGPNIVDPRSGEILSAHILIWEDVLKLINAWYFTMCAGVDPEARTWPLKDEIVGRLLRYAVAHEVGHSIGLRHNHRASTAFTVAQLRNKEFTAKYGSTASIMAYGRMNYVAQPEDGIPRESLIPKIGPYDYHAIQWSYASLTPSEEATKLDSWAREPLKNPWLVYGGEDLAAMVDPRVLTQNVGQERVEATRLGMLNLKRAMKFLVPAVEAKNKDYRSLYDAWIAVLDCRYQYLDSVSKEIGGREETRTTVGFGPQFKPVSRERQKAAVAYLLSEGLNWDPVYVSQDVFDRAVPFNVSHELRKYQGGTLSGMFTPMKLIQLSDSAIGGQNPYTIGEYLRDVITGVFSELSSSKEPNLLRRALHRQFFQVAESQFSVNMTEMAQLYKMVGAPSFVVESLSSSLETEYRLSLKLALRDLESKLDAAAKSTQDPLLAVHWSDCLTSTRRLLAR